MDVAHLWTQRQGRKVDLGAELVLRSFGFVLVFGVAT
jgi:hypothetical protein